MKLTLSLLVFGLGLTGAPVARASLSKSQRAEVTQEIRNGNYAILDRLSLNGQSLEQANVDIAALIKMIQMGNTTPLSDRRLQYGLVTIGHQDNPYSSPVVKPWDPNETARDIDPNVGGLNFGGGGAQGIEPHGGCINGLFLPGPGDPDGSGHLYPVPPQQRCH